MLYALTSAYSRKDYDNQEQGRPMETNIGKLFSIFAWGLDIVQKNAEMVKQWDDLEQARGAVLDRYGANWGVRRFSENDALYRLAIRVKILSQLSGGDTDTVIRAAADLLGIENRDVEFEDVFPAKIALYVDWLLLTQERQELIEPIAWAIKRIIAAGVGMRLYVRTYHTFRCAVDVKRGGAIGAFIVATPVNRDRENTDTVRINFGSLERFGLEPLPIGMDRSGRREITVREGSGAWADFSMLPIGEDRAHQETVLTAHGVSYEGRFEPRPIGRSRSERREVTVREGAGAWADLAPPPVSEDRTHQEALLTAHATAYEERLDLTPPDIERPIRGRQNGAGGVFYRTSIKPKRID